jgi:hypothetical protein
MHKTREIAKVGADCAVAAHASQGDLNQAQLFTSPTLTVLDGEPLCNRGYLLAINDPRLSPVLVIRRSVIRKSLARFHVSRLTHAGWCARIL